MKTEQYINAQPIISSICNVEIIEKNMQTPRSKTYFKIDPNQSGQFTTDTDNIKNAIGEEEFEDLYDAFHLLLTSKLAKRKKQLLKELDKI